jgi:uncharacterized phage-associated protein
MSDVPTSLPKTDNACQNLTNVKLSKNVMFCHAWFLGKAKKLCLERKKVLEKFAIFRI